MKLQLPLLQSSSCGTSKGYFPKSIRTHPTEINPIHTLKRPFLTGTPQKAFRAAIDHVPASPECGTRTLMTAPPTSAQCKQQGKHCTWSSCPCSSGRFWSLCCWLPSDKCLKYLDSNHSWTCDFPYVPQTSLGSLPGSSFSWQLDFMILEVFPSFNGGCMILTS